MKKKIVSCLLMLVLVTIALSGCVEETVPPVESKIIYVDDDGGADYTNIQDAIDNASDGDTVYVYNGTYYENIIVNRTAFLIGEDKNNTSINGVGGGHVVKISLSNHTGEFNISGFTINGGNNGNNSGIYISSSRGAIMNNIISNNDYGINVRLSNVTISNNLIVSSTSAGIYFSGVWFSIVRDNYIKENTCGIELKEGVWQSGDRLTPWSSAHNIITNNNILDNKLSIYVHSNSNHNLFYLNNFINNTANAVDEGNNSWDNGSVGNYWDDYQEKHPNATQLVGVWDIPYNISGGNNMDRFPTMPGYQSSKSFAKIKSVLYQLTQADNYSEFARTHFLEVVDNKIRVEILLFNEEYTLPSEFGVETNRYKDILEAFVYVDKLLDLANESNVRFIRRPLQAFPL